MRPTCVRRWRCSFSLAYCRDVKFPWITFLMGRPWGVDLMAQGIASMVLIWQGDPVIEVEVRGPPASRRQIRFRGGRATLAGP